MAVTEKQIWDEIHSLAEEHKELHDIVYENQKKWEAYLSCDDQDLLDIMISMQKASDAFSEIEAIRVKVVNLIKEASPK